MPLSRAFRRSHAPVYRPGRTGLAVVINEKDVVKNVDKATVQGVRAGSRTGALLGLMMAAAASLAVLAPVDALARSNAGLGADVTLSGLPLEAQRTDQLIHSGGPFPFSKDGAVFGNYEKRLPRQPRGWYHEYTVPTPGARDRGARRIICGGKQPTEPDACFYTEDHYNSFHRIVQ